MAAKKTPSKKTTKKATQERGAASKFIREQLEKGVTKPADIVEAGKKEGIDVTTGLIGAVKSGAKGAKKASKRGRPAKTAPDTTSTTTAQASIGSEYQAIIDNIEKDVAEYRQKRIAEILGKSQKSK